MRAFLLERGITARTDGELLRRELPALLVVAEQSLSGRMYRLLERMAEEWNEIDEHIEQFSSEIEAVAKSDDACQRLLTIPGVGPLGATAMVAAIGNGAAFSRGRDFATWLGLVPQQHSTGGKPKLLGISKRGNEYLRRLFVHGARAVVSRVKRDKLAFGDWITGLESRAHPSVVIVAVANKLARIAWAVLRRETRFTKHPVNGTAAAA